MTATAGVSEFRGFECPQYTNDLCIMVVEPWLDVTVDLILILSAEPFGNGLGTGTDFVGGMQSV